MSLSQHLAVLRELGTRDTATGADLLGLLEGARRSLSAAPLNINETRALLRLLRTLCDGQDAALARAARSAAAKGKARDFPQHPVTGILVPRLNNVPRVMKSYRNPAVCLSLSTFRAVKHAIQYMTRQFHTPLQHTI